MWESLGGRCHQRRLWRAEKSWAVLLAQGVVNVHWRQNCCFLVASGRLFSPKCTILATIVFRLAIVSVAPSILGRDFEEVKGSDGIVGRNGVWVKIGRLFFLRHWLAFILPRAQFPRLAKLEDFADFWSDR